MPMTQEQLIAAIESAYEYVRPKTPCAKYQEVMQMKSRYQSEYGVSQLAKDCQTAQSNMITRSVDGRKDY